MEYLHDLGKLTNFPADNEEFRDQQLIMKSFFDSSPAMMGIVDIIAGEMKQVFANDSGQRLFGKAHSSLDSASTSGVRPEDLRTIYERSRNSLTPVTVELEQTVQGQKIWLNFTANFIGRSQSGADRFSYIAFDITQQKKGEIESAAAMEARARFLANMTHEIRTPINGIMGAEQLLASTALTDEQKTYCAAIRVSAEGLLNLVNDILDLSKLKEGMLRFESIPFLLKDVVKEATDTIQFSARDEGLRIRVDYGDAIPEVLKGDSNRLKQVLLNLLSNAVKFSRHGLIDLRLRPLEKRGERFGVRFEVQDQGIGISEEAQKNLFQPFFQAESSTARHYGGTGLGLSICKYLVEGMNGSISVSSELGKGSTFTFDIYLPAGKLAPQLCDSSETKGEGTQFEGKVLFVDDSPVNLMIGQQALRKLGLDCEVTTNGKDALDVLGRYPFHLVFMDCQMPELDGYQTTLALRSGNGPNADVPVVALTASLFQEDKDRCLQAGMDGYLSKPFRADDLVAIMRRWNGRRHKSASPPNEEREVPGTAPLTSYASSSKSGP